jgi:TrmH family RNA methyltransferase
MQTVQNRTRIRIVQSRQNSRVKELRAAFARGGASDGGLAALEGMHLVAEALRSGLRVAAIFLREGCEHLVDTLNLEARTDLLALPSEIFSSAVSTESPQGIAALAEPPVFTLEQIFPAQESALILVVAGLQDPGNFGTIVRSAEAFGARGILALPGTVSVWNAKTLRASAGSAFRVPVIAVGEAEAFRLLGERGIRILATVPQGGASISELNLRQPVAFLIGNEGSGLPESLVKQATATVTIPCPGAVESLNAAVATSIVLYEASRQRALSESSLSESS